MSRRCRLSIAASPATGSMASRRRSTDALTLLFTRGSRTFIQPAEFNDEGGFNGPRTAPASLSLRRASALHVEGNARIPSRQAPSGLCDERQQPAQGFAARVEERR